MKKQTKSHPVLVPLVAAAIVFNGGLATATAAEVGADTNAVVVTTAAPASTATNTTVPPSKSIQNVRQYIFSDVPSDFWAAPAISVMTREKAMTGYSDGTFRPNKPLTREEAAALFNNIIGDTQNIMLASSFNDITSDRWSAVAIESVARKNIISGYGNNTYQPEKYMSRQEFAVVADNYIHYLGYVTDDPTVLDTISYSDQKFIAPWAQDAVRELASLGFLMYSPNTLFNPEKYITRAEAAEMTYRMTHTEQAVAFRNTIFKQQVESKAVELINKTLNFNGDFTKFRSVGAMFWNNNTLQIAVVNSKELKKIGSALALSKDPVLTQNVSVHSGKYNQTYFDELQLETTYKYNQLEPKGTVLSIKPDLTASTLTLTVDTLSAESQKAFTKEFGKKATIQTQPLTQDDWAQTVSFPLARGIRTNK